MDKKRGELFFNFSKAKTWDGAERNQSFDTCVTPQRGENELNVNIDEREGGGILVEANQKIRLMKSDRHAQIAYR